MVDREFKGYLKQQGLSIGKYYTNGKVLGLNAINDIIKWAKSVERAFEVDLDSIVRGSDETQSLLDEIQTSYEIMDKQKKNLSGAVRAYYEFVNGHELQEL